MVHGAPDPTDRAPTRAGGVAACRVLTAAPAAVAAWPHGHPRRAGPKLRQVVLDTEDARGLAEFYRELLGLAYRQGDEPPPPGRARRTRPGLAGAADGEGVALAFQQVEPRPAVDVARARPAADAAPRHDASARPRSCAGSTTARSRWARRLLHDRFDDPEEPLYVFADPAGHPFCIFVA